MPKSYESADLRHNVERAIRFDTEAGRPVLKVEPEALEFEVFVRIAGSDAEPQLLGRFPASRIIQGD